MCRLKLFAVLVVAGAMVISGVVPAMAQEGETIGGAEVSPTGESGAISPECSQEVASSGIEIQQVFEGASEDAPSILIEQRPGAYFSIMGEYSQFLWLLVENGYAVSRIMEGELTYEMLSEFDVFIAMTTRSYGVAERSDLAWFVDRGGGLFLIADHSAYYSNPVQSLANIFGVTLDANVVFDTDDCLGSVSPLDGWITYSSKNFADHPITEGLTKIQSFYTTSMIGGVAIVRTDDDGTATPSDRPVVVATGFGAGRVVVVGDLNYFNNSRGFDVETYPSDNEQFALNIVDWLSGRSVSLDEALDYYAHPVITDGDQKWFGQKNEYIFYWDAAQSGNITHGQSSSMKTTFTGPGVPLFYWKVSSQRNKDFLAFYVNGSLIGSISGEVGWQQGRGPFLAAGDHTLEWRYTKDRSISAGSDCGWVDRLLKPTVVDYAQPNTDSGYIEFLQSLGVTAVLRYIGGTNPGYFINKEEAAKLHDAGFAIGLIWQARRNVIARGYDGGKKDAEDAIKNAAAIGFPDDLPIYFVANDWHVTKASELATTVEYFRGIRAVFGDRPIGAYGQCSVIKSLIDNPNTRVEYGWQAAANGWSSGCWDERITMRQTIEYKNIDYTDSKGKTRKTSLDFNDVWIYPEDWGIWLWLP